MYYDIIYNTRREATRMLNLTTRISDYVWVIYKQLSPKSREQLYRIAVR